MAKKTKAVEKKADALVAPTYIEERTHLVRLNVKALEPALRERISGILREAQEAMTSIARSHLKIGKAISDARMLLESRGSRMFLAFINEIPGMSQATAYRYMDAWDHARGVFPEPILNRILAANLPMLGGPDQLFGKYTEAAKKSGLDKQLASAVSAGKVNDEFADSWIKNLQVAQAKEHGGRKTKVPDPTVLQKEAFQAVRRRYNKLPDKKKSIAWFSSLFAYVLYASGVASPVTVDPRKPPTDWEEVAGASTRDENKAREEGEAGKKANGKEAAA